MDAQPFSVEMVPPLAAWTSEVRPDVAESLTALADPSPPRRGHADHQGVIGHVPGHDGPAATNACLPMVWPQITVALAPIEAPSRTRV